MIMEDRTLRNTPLVDIHKLLGAKLAPFGGWLMPIQYEGIIAEHAWTRKSASLFDICHMGEFLICGDTAERDLNRILTSDIPGIDIGRCRYGFMLNENGGIIDDLVTYRIQDKIWMLVVNAATRDKDFDHIKKNLSLDSSIEDISVRTAKLDLQGPLSQDILAKLVSERVLNLAYYSFAKFAALGEDSIISRTGYTGELGYELYVDALKVENLWDMLLKDERVKPAGLGARDTLRLEMGYPLYGQELDETITPLEAGMESFIDFKKDFIGKEALLKKKEEGLEKKIIHFISSTRRSPRHSDIIFSEGKEVGYVTSGSFSPSLGLGIGMGYVENGYDWIGGKVTIKDKNKELQAEITDKPFYKEGTARK